MVDQSVNKLIEDFCKFWQPELSSSLSYQLDSTWPSVGLADLFLSSCWGEQHLLPLQSDMFKQLSAYIATLAHDIWVAYGFEVQVGIDSEHGVVFSAQGGALVPQQTTYQVYIEKELLKLFSSAPSHMEVFRNTFCTINPSSRPVSLFVLGLLCGLSPRGSGSLLKESQNALRPHCFAIVEALAIQTSLHYMRIFPDEPLGAIPELYLHNLIAPPLFMETERAGEMGLKGILQFANIHSIDRAQLVRLAENLSQINDELISLIGLELYCVFAEPPFSSQVVSRIFLRTSLVPYIRANVAKYRMILGLAEDWLHAQDTNTVAAEYQRELMLGLLPCMVLSVKDLLKVRETDIGLLSALASSELVRASEIINSQIDWAKDYGIVLQRWFLDILLDKISNNFIAQIPSVRYERGNPVAQYVIALSLMAKGSIHAAIDYLYRAEAHMNRDHWLYWPCVDLLMEMLYQEKLYDAVLNIADNSSLVVKSVSALITELKCLRAMGREGEALVVRKELLKYYSNNVQVFKEVVVSK